MTEINKTTGPSQTSPLGTKPMPATPKADGVKSATDQLSLAPASQPTDTKLALKVIKGLELPPKPRIMIREATRDAWVRDAATTLVSAKKALDMLRGAALDPRTPVSDADWQAAKTKVASLGQALATVDKNSVRGEAFQALVAPHLDAFRAAMHYPEGPKEPKAREAWKTQGEAVMKNARAAQAALSELQADTGVNPYESRSMGGSVHDMSAANDHRLDQVEAMLNAPPPGKLDGLSSFIKGVGAIAAAVEIAPNGQIRERRR